jgi:hypothetical protein
VASCRSPEELTFRVSRRARESEWDIRLALMESTGPSGASEFDCGWAAECLLHSLG